MDDSAIIEIAEVMLAAGADMNAGEMTVLHSAVLANTGKSDASTDLEEFLLSKGANVFARDSQQNLPLHYAFLTQAK